MAKKPTADQKRKKQKKEKARASAERGDRFRKGLKAIDSIAHILFAGAVEGEVIDVAQLVARMNALPMNSADAPNQRLSDMLKEPMVESVFETIRQLVELQEVQQAEFADLEPLGGRFHEILLSTWNLNVRAHPVHYMIARGLRIPQALDEHAVAHPDLDCFVYSFGLSFEGLSITLAALCVAGVGMKGFIVSSSKVHPLKCFADLERLFLIALEASDRPGDALGYAHGAAVDVAFAETDSTILDHTTVKLMEAAGSAWASEVDQMAEGVQRLKEEVKAEAYSGLSERFDRELGRYDRDLRNMTTQHDLLQTRLANSVVRSEVPGQSSPRTVARSFVDRMADIF